MRIAESLRLIREERTEGKSLQRRQDRHILIIQGYAPAWRGGRRTRTTAIARLLHLNQCGRYWEGGDGGHRQHENPGCFRIAPCLHKYFSHANAWSDSVTLCTRWKEVFVPVIRRWTKRAVLLLMDSCPWHEDWKTERGRGRWISTAHGFGEYRGHKADLSRGSARHEGVKHAGSSYLARSRPKSARWPPAQRVWLTATTPMSETPRSF